MLSTLRFRFRLPSAAAMLFALACMANPVPSAGEEDDWGAAPSAPTSAGTFSKSGLSAKIIPLKEKANALYRAKRYLEAGRLYREIADLDTSDAAVRNDMGLCFMKLRMKDSALEAGREALRLADRSLGSDDTARWSIPDLRARKSAYFTLDKLGGPMPEPRPGKCEIWSSFSACQERLHVCAEAGQRPASGAGVLHWDILRIGLTRARALFDYDEVEVPSQVVRPEMRDMEELSIEGAYENRMQWLNRDSSVTIPLGEHIETADSACVGKACGNLERVRTECRVIHFDPCAGVVGVACGIEEGGGKDRIVVGEFYLIPAK